MLIVKIIIDVQYAFYPFSDLFCSIGLKGSSYIA